MESGSVVLVTLLFYIFLPNVILSLHSTCNETASTPPCNVSSTASTNISMTSSDGATSIVVMSSLTSDMTIDTSPSTMEPGSGSGDTVSQLIPIDTSSAETQASSTTSNASPTPTATAPSPSTTAATTSTPTTMPPTSVPPTISSSTTSSSSSPSTSEIVTDATSTSNDPTGAISDSPPVESGSSILGVVIGGVMAIFLGIILVAAMVIIYYCRTRKHPKMVQKLSPKQTIEIVTENCPAYESYVIPENSSVFPDLPMAHIAVTTCPAYTSSAFIRLSPEHIYESTQ